MFKAARWRSEKSKIKAVFKFQFQVSQAPVLGWDTMMVIMIPTDAGRPTMRSDKAAVVDGTCKWLKPIYETVKLTQDPKSGKTNEKVYQFIVSSTGSTKAGILGEASINIADYAEEFKPSSVSLPLKTSTTTGALLHITLQRMQGSSGDERDVEENGVTISSQTRRTLQSQLSNTDKDEGGEIVNGMNGITSTDEESFTNGQTHLKNPSSRALPLRSHSCVDLRKSSSSDTISATGSESSSGQYTPKENGIKNNSSHQEIQDSVSFLSSLSNSGTPQKAMTSLFDWSVSSAPDGSMDGSANSSGDAALRERLQDPDISLEKLRSDAVALARQLERSELELQTLRKQVVKESRRGQDLLKELGGIKQERDSVQRECEELKALQKRTADDNASSKLKLNDRDPWSMIDEIKQELKHERNSNSNLRVQLQKTQESNAELLLALRDLDQLLEEKNAGLLGVNRQALDFSPRASDESKESAKSHLQSSDGNQEIFPTISADYDEEQYELEELVKERDDVRTGYSPEQQIMDLKSEIELYRKDREDLEMQMEQIALDYEILKQENHDISSKLEQSQLREQLRMQYECSAHLAIINDLEDQVQSLEKELANQAEAFEADLESIMHAKVEQEQRAINAEELLRKTRSNNANIAERLQEEFKRLSEQMSSTFYTNEKLALQAVTEASELRLQKCHLEEMLKKSKEQLASAQSQFQVKFKDLFTLINMKTEEADKLLLELKKKSEELERTKKSDEVRRKASLEEVLLLKAEIEKLSAEKTSLCEEIKQKEQLANKMEQLNSAAEDATKSLEELDDWRCLKDEKETVIKTLYSELETIKLQYMQLNHSLIEDEIEKEKLRKQVCELRGELWKKEETLISTAKKLKDSSAKPAVSCEAAKIMAKKTNSKVVLADNSNKEFASLHEKIKLLEEEIKLKDTAVEDAKNLFSTKEKDPSNNTVELENCRTDFRGNCLGLSHATCDKSNCFVAQNRDMGDSEKDADAKLKQDSISLLQEVKKGSKNPQVMDIGDVKNATEAEAGIHDLSGTCGGMIVSSTKGDADKEEVSVSCACDPGNVTEALHEMAALKARNQSMEAELKEMQQRYSEISLKFAEVEGERQQLVMRIRTLKNASKN